jgi:hypothetical protein
MVKCISTLIILILLALSLAGCGTGGGNTSSGDNSIAPDNNVPTSTISLAWDAPVNSEGLPLANVAGYKVYYGTSSGSYDKQINVGPRTTCTIDGLAPGTYYIAVSCYDIYGNESSFSNEASKSIQ